MGRCNYRDLYEFCTDQAEYEIHYELGWPPNTFCQKHHDETHAATDKYVRSIEKMKEAS